MTTNIDSRHTIFVKVRNIQLPNHIIITFLYFSKLKSGTLVLNPQ